MNRAKRLVAVLLGALALLLGAAGTASAHAALLSTSPAANAVVQTAPSEVTLHFSEQVTLATDAVRVFDPSGQRVDTGATGHAGTDPSTAQVRLRAGLGQGTYTVAWRAISADTHPVSGAFTFSYGHTSAVTAVPGEGAIHGSPVVGALYGIARGVQYGAFALLVGAAALVLAFWPGGVALRGVQRLMLTGWAALLVATIAELLLRGPYAQASGLGKAFDLSLVQQTLGERLGTLLAVRILLLAAVGVLLALLAPGAPRGRLRAALGAAGAALAVGLALTWALGDHASVGIQVGLAVPLDVVHLLAMAGWLGGLAAVITGLRTPPAEGGVGPAEVRRYSALALGSVTALAASGAYAAWRGLGSWDALLSTTYGRLLLVKLGLVAVIIGAAWLSRRWTALLRGEAAEVVGADPDPVEAARAEALAHADAATAGTRPLPAGDAGNAGDADGGSEEDGPGESGSGAADPRRREQLARQEQARAAAAARRAREAAPARGMLLRSTLLEALLAVVVLVVTTLLTNAPPGRAVAEAQAASRPVSATVAYDTGGATDGAKGRVRVEIDPARVGTVAVQAYVTDAAGRPVDVPELDLALTLPARNLGPLAVKPAKAGTGHWTATGVDLPMAGTWTLSVSVRSDAIDEITATAQVRIGS
jgi:copper transport protein